MQAKEPHPHFKTPIMDTQKKKKNLMCLTSWERMQWNGPQKLGAGGWRRRGGGLGQRAISENTTRTRRSVMSGKSCPQDDILSPHISYLHFAALWIVWAKVARSIVVDSSLHKTASPIKRFMSLENNRRDRFWINLGSGLF